MSVTKQVVWLLVTGFHLFLLGGCSEGGIGGTGAGATGNPANVTLSGQGNKGPFVAGTSITVMGITGNNGEATTTSGLLGQFELQAPQGSVQRVTLSGNYFNELSGETSASAVNLSGIVVVGSTARANINVATHLASGRIEDLVSDGLAADVAVLQATDELLLALSPVIPAPANQVVLTNLVLVNASQVSGNPEGNAWLLALSALVEGAAHASGSATAEVLDALAADFSDDGTLVAANLALLASAVPLLDPDAIHSHLLNLDAGLRGQVLGSLASVPDSEASALPCRVYQSEVICLDFSEPPATLSEARAILDAAASNVSANLDLETLVANLNRFLDTDGDGEVNAEDDDDDNDGTQDSEDASPYGV